MFLRKFNSQSHSDGRSRIQDKTRGPERDSAWHGPVTKRPCCILATSDQPTANVLRPTFFAVALGFMPTEPCLSSVAPAVGSASVSRHAAQACAPADTALQRSSAKLTSLSTICRYLDTLRAFQLVAGQLNIYTGWSASEMERHWLFNKIDIFCSAKH